MTGALSSPAWCWVLPESDIESAREEILAAYPLEKPVMLVSGGTSRQASVWNGISAIGEEDVLVAVHDAVRPFVPQEALAHAVAEAGLSGAATLAIPVVDTLRLERDGRSEPLSREGVWSVQTPQVFRLELLKSAHKKAMEDGIDGTDDAGIVERLGVPVRIVEGSPLNFKVTRPDDLILAEAVCRLES